MRRPRFKTKTFMILVALIGLFIHLAIKANLVYTTKESHTHTYFDVMASGPALHADAHLYQPFWPRYWRCLVGRPWKGQPVCDPIEGRLEELCQYEHPEILEPTGPTTAALRFSKPQLALAERYGIKFD